MNEQCMNYAEKTALHQDRPAQLALLRQGLTLVNPKGYPALDERLHLPYVEYKWNVWRRLILPDGPWDISHGQLPANQEKLRCQNLELDFDSQGRPLHPWAAKILADPEIGGVVGKGEFYEWGPNFTADSVIINSTNQTILLVKRAKTGIWALPGGFIDPGELPKQAAIREVGEESGLDINEADYADLVYAGPVADVRTTLNAWPETSCYLFQRAGSPAPQPRDSEIAAAAWLPLEQARQMALWGSHNWLIEQALRQL